MPDLCEAPDERSACCSTKPTEGEVLAAPPTGMFFFGGRRPRPPGSRQDTADVDGVKRIARPFGDCARTRAAIPRRAPAG